MIPPALPRGEHDPLAQVRKGMPQLCHFYGLAPAAIYDTTIEDYNELVNYMNEYHRKAQQQG